MLFKPEKLPKDFQFNYDNQEFKEYNLETRDGAVINGIRFFPKGESKGVVLYLKGNSKSIKGWGKFAVDFTRHGYNVLMVDYRGFGKSTGRRTQKALKRDLQEVYNKIKEMTTSCICVTLNSCLTGLPVYYYTCKQSSAQTVFITGLAQGQLIEINDAANFPETYYTFQSFCTIPGVVSAACTTCTNAPNRITDDPGRSIDFWIKSNEAVCPTDNAYNDVYVLTNCLANVVVNNNNIDSIILCLDNIITL